MDLYFNFTNIEKGMKRYLKGNGKLNGKRTGKQVKNYR